MNSQVNNIQNIVAVVIGRNEGQRLITCLDSLLGCVLHIVYVDSGSSDQSVQEAKNRNIGCVSLDMSIPFTAARARNEGVKYLLQHASGFKYIQFIDGDCEIDFLWIDKAHVFLNENTEYAAVCGRRRERYPQYSIYNQLCDIEWNTPIGDALACGGDALIRADAFQQVEGYREDLIAGEEPEMCFRLRRLAWKVYRLDAEMTLHDAAMTQFSQWWRRAKRAGYAYAGSCYLHGRSAEKFKVKQVMSIITWAFLMPVFIVLLSLQSFLFLFLFTIFPIQVFRLMIKEVPYLTSYKNSFFYALSNVVSKFPQFIGLMKFVVNNYQGRQATLIEYK